MQTTTTTLLLLLAVIVALVAAQATTTAPKGNRYYIAGSFNRINAFTRAGGPACWDPKASSWVRPQTALKQAIATKSNLVYLNENEAFYTEQNQVWYFNGTNVVAYVK